MIQELQERNIYVTYNKMKLEVWGILYYNSYGEYHIGINDRLADNQQLKVLKHELKHIEHDLPEHHRIIGMDMHCTELENEEYNKASELIVACLSL